MIRIRLNTCIATAVILAAFIAGGQARTWTSADGRKTFEGELRHYDPANGTVSIITSQGALITFSQSKLSKADIAYLIEQTKEAADGSHGSALLVDPSTLTGKVMCGYQGWFTCDGDDAKLGWVHWARDRMKPFGPGNVTVDLWPDVSELSQEARFTTGFRLKSGAPAEVFSSHHRETVLLHFKWMREYGIDGAFLQRFANGLADERLKQHKNTVLTHVREGARVNGRAYAVMYDLSGLAAGQVQRVQEDWKMLREQEKITNDRAYLHHKGKPLVAVWGIGFSDDRSYTLGGCEQLVSFLVENGCSVMLGVPSWWREGKRDAVSDPALQKLIEKADVVSPWSVGRYATPDQAKQHAQDVWKNDLQWCRRRKIDFLPVVFPGFSWHNLKGKGFKSIPRMKGEFLQSQFDAAMRIRARMIYVAMFDEVDEGTAIFKCTNDVPVGDGVQFLDYEGLPSDHYLRLTGQAAKKLHGRQ